MDLRLQVILKVSLQTGSFHALQHLVGWQKEDDKKDLRLLVILKVELQTGSFHALQHLVGEEMSNY